MGLKIVLGLLPGQMRAAVASPTLRRVTLVSLGLCLPQVRQVGLPSTSLEGEGQHPSPG